MLGWQETASYTETQSYLCPSHFPHISMAPKGNFFSHSQDHAVPPFQPFHGSPLPWEQIHKPSSQSARSAHGYDSHLPFVPFPFAHWATAPLMELLPHPLQSIYQLRAFAWAVPSLLSALPQGLCSKAVSSECSSLIKLSKIPISLCLISLPNFSLLLRPHIMHSFIHLLSIFCNTLWIPGLSTPVLGSVLAHRDKQ